MFDFNKSKEILKEKLKKSRYKHSLGVVKAGLALNAHHKLKIDEDRIKCMCLLHDCCKHLEDEYYSLYKISHQLDDSILDDRFKLHAILAAIACKDEYGVNDLEIQEAIRVHTTGKLNMNVLDKLLYLADAIEENRDYPGLDNIIKMADKNLNLGVLASMDNTIGFLKEKNVKIDEETFLVREGIRRDIMQEKLDIVLKACEDKLGSNIKTIKISEKSTIADYFVIVTGGSKPQIKAITEEIEDKIREAGYDYISREGLRDGGWILIDLGDIIVHVFTEDQREFYNLEKLWD